MNIHGHKQENKKTSYWFEAVLTRLFGQSDAQLSATDDGLDALRWNLLPK